MDEGVYPVLGYGDAVIGYVQLNIGDIWKVGFTGNGEKGRYPSRHFYKSKNGYLKITKEQLSYDPISKGSSKEMITLEKLVN